MPVSVSLLFVRLQACDRETLSPGARMDVFDPDTPHSSTALHFGMKRTSWGFRESTSAAGAMGNISLGSRRIRHTLTDDRLQVRCLAAGLAHVQLSNAAFEFLMVQLWATG